jgi:hypothetical protein
MLVRQVCVLDQQIMKVELRFDDAEQPLVRLMHPQPDDATLLAGERANFLDSDFAHTLTISIECAVDDPASLRQVGCFGTDEIERVSRKSSAGIRAYCVRVERCRGRRGWDLS